MDLLVVGLNHRTAPVAIREKLAVPTEACESTLRGLATAPALQETVLLGTCNRVEVYAVAADPDGAAEIVRRQLTEMSGLSYDELAPHLYQHGDRHAVRHLFRVASSLDSLVVGEPQILGQLKDAYELAVRCDTVGSSLKQCFPRAFRIARRVRRETAIACMPVSVSSVAVDLAQQVFGGFDGRSVLLVGAGKMADLAARALRAKGAIIRVTNRTPARAEELAARVGGTTLPFDDLAGALEQADIVVSSTGARQPVLDRPLLARVQKTRRNRPLLLVDIAVPRDVDPRCTEIEGVFLADIDDLQKVAASHLDGRNIEATRAETMVDEEVTRFFAGLRSRSLAPTISALRARYLGIARGEAEKLVAALPQLGEREQQAILGLADGIAQKLLHAPQVALREAAANEGDPLLDAVRRIFDLQVAEPPLEPAADEDGATSGKVEHE